MARGRDTWTVLALVRHGQSQGNVDGRFGGHSATPLTDLGHRQARRTAEALVRSFGPTLVVSSDLVRARQTALPIAQEAGVELLKDARLRERSLGILDGMSFEQVKADHPDMWRRLRSRDPTVCPPGGETVDDLFARVSAAVNDTVRTHVGQRVVIVSHGLALFHAFAHICGLGSPATGLTVFTLVENCSISRMTYRGDYWYATSWNETAHLAGLEPHP